MRCRTTAAAVLVASALGLTACSTTNGVPEPSATPLTRGGTLLVYSPFDPVSSGWDPSSADPRIQRVMGPAVMATLLRPDPSGGAPTPWLAESVVTDAAATTWTITVKSGVTFDDGSPLVAQDVAFMLSASAAIPALSTRFGTDGDGSSFVSARAVDQRTVAVTLSAPNALLDRMVFAAPEFGCVKNRYGGVSRDNYFRAPASCGPFTVGPPSADATTSVQLVRNARYFDAATVLPDAVSIGTGQRALRTADVVLNAPPAGNPQDPDSTAMATSPPTSAASTTPASPAPSTSSATVAATTPPATVAASPTVPSSTVSPSTAPTTSVPPTTSATTSSTADGVWTTDQLVESAPGVTTMLALRAVPPTRDENLRQALRFLPDLTALAAASPGAVPATAGLTPVGWPGAVAVAAAGARADIARTAVELVPEDQRVVRLLVDETDPVAMQRAGALSADAAAVGLTLEVQPKGRGGYDDDLAARRFQAALVSVAPTVLDAAELPRLWAVTVGFGGGWPPQIGTDAYPATLSAPVHGEAAVAAQVAFEDAVRRGVFAVPLVTDVHRIGNRTGVPGVSVGVVGDVSLDLMAPADRQN